MHTLRTKMRILFVSFFLLTSCAWNSDEGWSVATTEPEKIEKEGFQCAGENEFGKFMKGGGCNAFGCWMEGGSCNSFGCSVDGNCDSSGCPKKIQSIQCEE